MLEEYGQDTRHVLEEDPASFPFEYYAVKFFTFSGGPYAGFSRHVCHLKLDSARIDTDHAAQEYTRTLYNVNVAVSDRYPLENSWRQQKDRFQEQHLSAINQEIETCQFGIRSGMRAGLEASLDIMEDGVPIRDTGKGRQRFIKTEFALRRREQHKKLDVLLLGEPENHLSHVNMKKLVSKLAQERQMQLFVAIHSSHISSRLDLRDAILLGKGRPVSLHELPEDTARFFMKAPNINVLEFALAQRVIHVEGHAEFILTDAFYRGLTGRVPEHDGVHIISIGGTSFRRYLELARLLENRIASVRDNDGDYQQNCVDRFAKILSPDIRMFSDENPDRSTFEIYLYQDNVAICAQAFGSRRRWLSVQDYMLANKAEAAFELLELNARCLYRQTFVRPSHG